MPSGGRPDYAQAVWRYLAAAWGVPPSTGTVSDFSAERDRLGAERAAASRPAAGALAAFPAGSASFELALCGAGALLAGFLIGLPGRQGRRRLLAGGVAALLALLTYLALVALLPATQLPELLLALPATQLPVSLRTLLRVAVLLRQRQLAVIP